MRYLIDGYNLAHWLARDDDLRPDQLRLLLLTALGRRRPRDATRIEVYWDVRRPNPSVPAREDLGWCVQFNVPDADAAIVDAVYDADQPRRCVVVSRDREVTGRSRQLGARTKAPGDLLGKRR